MHLITYRIKLDTLSKKKKKHYKRIKNIRSILYAAKWYDSRRHLVRLHRTLQFIVVRVSQPPYVYCRLHSFGRAWTAVLYMISSWNHDDSLHFIQFDTYEILIWATTTTLSHDYGKMEVHLIIQYWFDSCVIYVYVYICFIIHSN